MPILSCEISLNWENPNMGQRIRERPTYLDSGARDEQNERRSVVPFPSLTLTFPLFFSPSLPLSLSFSLPYTRFHPRTFSRQDFILEHSVTKFHPGSFSSLFLSLFPSLSQSLCWVFAANLRNEGSDAANELMGNWGVDNCCLIVSVLWYECSLLTRLCA